MEEYQARGSRDLFFPCRIEEIRPVFYCCKAPRNWRDIRGVNVLDGTGVRVKAFQDELVQCVPFSEAGVVQTPTSGIAVTDYVLVDLDERAGSVVLLACDAAGAGSAPREDLDLPADGALRTRLVAAFKQDATVIVTVARLVKDVEVIISFRQEEGAAPEDVRAL
jgi:hypothetical protein